MIRSDKIQVILDLLNAEYPSGWTGMLAKSAKMFYRNLMFAIGNHVPNSTEPLYVTIPTSLLTNFELDALESTLTNSRWRIVERDRDYYKVVPGTEEPSRRSLIMEGRLCPYCNVKTVFNGDRWECPQCMAYVECHKGTMVSMGFVARPSLRKMRHELHAAMDALWMSGLITRGELYYRLRKILGLTKAECHVAKFDENMCKKAMEAVNQIKDELKNEQSARSNDAHPETGCRGDAAGSCAASPTGSDATNAAPGSNAAGPSGDASADGSGTISGDAGTADAAGTASPGSDATGCSAGSAVD